MEALGQFPMFPGPEVGIPSNSWRRSFQMVAYNNEHKLVSVDFEILPEILRGPTPQTPHISLMSQQILRRLCLNWFDMVEFQSAPVVVPLAAVGI